MRPVRVCVINLDRRPDRLRAFRARWEQAAPGVSVQRIAGAEVPGNPVQGCWRAHIDALSTGGGAPLLVLEDDVVFSDAFTLDLPEPPPGWQLLRLGGLVQAGTPPAGSWIALTRARHTHAYVAADPAGLAARLARAPVRDMGVALTAGIAGQYRLWPGTAGQAAGTSDITGLTRDTDQYWG